MMIARVRVRLWHLQRKAPSRIEFCTNLLIRGKNNTQRRRDGH